ncbi:MAG: hypothetical protein U1E76_29015, partial [Planctomycetota bacterium]
MSTPTCPGFAPSTILPPGDRVCRVAWLYHELYDGRGFSRVNNSWQRYRLGRERLAELGWIG